MLINCVLFGATCKILQQRGLADWMIEPRWERGSNVAYSQGNFRQKWDPDCINSASLSFPNVAVFSNQNVVLLRKEIKSFARAEILLPILLIRSCRTIHMNWSLWEKWKKKRNWDSFNVLYTTAKSLLDCVLQLLQVSKPLIEYTSGNENICMCKKKNNVKQGTHCRFA